MASGAKLLEQRTKTTTTTQAAKGPNDGAAGGRDAKRVSFGADKNKSRIVFFFFGRSEAK